jgi:hypothetical protein
VNETSNKRAYIVTPLLSDKRSPRAREIEALTHTILKELFDLGEPSVFPKHIAPRLGLLPNSLCYHCRNLKHMRAWRGHYEFHLDDKEHVVALTKLIEKTLWSLKRLPSNAKQFH